MANHSETNITKLILIPSLITLAITILRLVGELMNWTPILFNRNPGGGGALLGISWLPLILGIYFARKLIQAGDVPETSGGRVILSAIGGIALMFGAAYFAFGQGPSLDSPVKFIAGILAFVIAMLVPFNAWRKLFKALFTYGLAARIPVALLMLFAIQGNWGTHYDVPPSPDFPVTEWFTKYLLIGLIPQLFVWIPFTVLSGALTAGITAAIMQRGKATKMAEA